MIPVERTKKPLYLEDKAKQLLKELKEAKSIYDNINTDPNSTELEREKAKKVFEKAQGKYNPPDSKKYGKKPVKNALYDMFCGKCAYCESKEELSAAHIEHFKPKSNYIDLTFDWNNLLYSCRVCNDTGHKGDKFPLDAQGNDLLIDPTDENCDIYEHLEFYWDHRALETTIAWKNKRGEIVVKIFELNRDILRKKRDSMFEMLFILLDDALAGKPKPINILIKACKSESEYSAFALFYILPYLAHHFRIPEAIELIKKVSKRSLTYAKFARVDDLQL